MGSTLIEARMQRILGAAHKAGAGAALLRDTSAIAWATGFEGVFDEERAHALLLAEGVCALHTDSRYSGACRAAAQGGAVEIDDALDEQGRGKTHAAWAAERLQGLGVTALAIEDSIALGEYRKLCAALEGQPEAPSLVETSGMVVGLRAVKDAAEIERLRAAQAITDAAFAHIVGFMKPGLTEAEVRAELDNFMMRHGAEGLAFPSIVATGPNGANPHAQPGQTRLEAGQCVVLDFGARARGYCSDMTRMVFVGAPDARLRDAYEALRAANEEVQAFLRPGVTGAAAHALALQVLSGRGWPDAFGHGLGHGVGIDIHEEPVLAPRNTEPLAPGNVVTVEPGIYVDGEFGMRLEDCGVVTDSGFEAFGTSTHDMVVV